MAEGHRARNRGDAVGCGQIGANFGPETELTSLVWTRFVKKFSGKPIIFFLLRWRIGFHLTEYVGLIGLEYHILHDRVELTLFNYMVNV